VLQIEKMPNVTLYRDSRLTAENVLEFGFERVVLATGATWRRDGYGRSHWEPDPWCGAGQGVHARRHHGDKLPPAGPVVVYDTEEFYMGGLIAEKLRKAGHDVTLVTPRRHRVGLGWQHHRGGAHQQAAAPARHHGRDASRCHASWRRTMSRSPAAMERPSSRSRPARSCW
jgi:NADPH-dependent 2,4-dienoyl-CoA reductase/sulfur reductase-like enzyme